METGGAQSTLGHSDACPRYTIGYSSCRSQLAPDSSNPCIPSTGVDVVTTGGRTRRLGRDTLGCHERSIGTERVPSSETALSAKKSVGCDQQAVQTQIYGPECGPVIRRSSPNGAPQQRHTFGGAFDPICHATSSLLLSFSNLSLSSSPGRTVFLC